MCPVTSFPYVTYNRLLMGKTWKQQRWQELRSLPFGATLSFSELHLDSDHSSFWIWCLVLKLCFFSSPRRSRALNPGLVHLRQVLYHPATAQVSIQISEWMTMRKINLTLVSHWPTEINSCGERNHLWLIVSYSLSPPSFPLPKHTHLYLRVTEI